jgi:hypothetical protein
MLRHRKGVSKFLDSLSDIISLQSRKYLFVSKRIFFFFLSLNSVKI